MSWLLNKFRTVKRGFFESFKSTIPKHERPDWFHFNFADYCDRFDGYYNDHTDIKSCCLTIAGQGTAEGVFVVPSGDYPRAQEAADKCDALNERLKLDQKIYETMLLMVKHGTCFWEKDFNAVDGLDAQLIPHQKYMAPVFNDRQLVGWEYRYHGTALYKWTLDTISVFAWNVGSYAPFGTSLLTGIDEELETKTQILKNMKAYLEKQAFATNVLQVGDQTYHPIPTEVSAIESKVKNREVGEDFVTDYPIELKTMGAASIETRMIPDTLAFTQERITDALMMPPISKLYNSTEASATVMTDWCRASIITPLQRIIKRVVEAEIYWPYLEDLGFAKKVVPSLQFEPPEADIKLTEEVNIIDLVKEGIVSRRTAARELGFEEEFDTDKLDQWEKPQPMFQKGKEEGEQGEGEEGKSWKVTELKKR